MICKNFDTCEYWFCRTHKICLLHYSSLPRKDRMRLMGIDPRPHSINNPPKGKSPQTRPITPKRATIARKKKNHKDEQILAKTNGLCWLCEEPIKFQSQYSRDHKIPLSKGGTNTIDNLFPSHISCNNLKGNSLINTSEEFLTIFKPKLLLKNLTNQQEQPSLSEQPYEVSPGTGQNKRT